jgi:hypothetical protein
VSAGRRVDAEIGVSAAAQATSLGDLLEGGETMTTLRHHRVPTAKKSLCGDLAGFFSDGKPGSNTVTCPACLAELRARDVAKADRKANARALRTAGLLIRRTG